KSVAAWKGPSCSCSTPPGSSTSTKRSRTSFAVQNPLPDRRRRRRRSTATATATATPATVAVAVAVADLEHEPEVVGERAGGLRSVWCEREHEADDELLRSCVQNRTRTPATDPLVHGATVRADSGRDRAGIRSRTSPTPAAATPAVAITSP